MAEKALIGRIRGAAGRSGRGLAGGSARAAQPGLRVGIGDDCAVLAVPAGHEMLVTTDFSLEGVHFRRDWHPAESAGHRCLARGLSDIAAMGGEPRAVFLSLGLPGKIAQGWVDRFLKGLTGLASAHGVPLAGGDTAESPGGVLADIVVVGSVPRGQAVLRSRARVGDRIFVSGKLGGSAAAIARMEAGKKLRPRDWPRHFFPEPRVELGKMLRAKGLATAMIDLSDGLSTDLTHLCRESGVGAEIEGAAIPLARAGGGDVSLELALHGGEDYELLFTVPTGRRVPARMAGVELTCIGHIKRGKRVLLMNAGELKAQGWEHFRK